MEDPTGKAPETPLEEPSRQAPESSEPGQVVTDVPASDGENGRLPRRRIERWVFLGLLIGMSLLFLYVMKPFFGPILWACILALMFNPLRARLARLIGNRPTIVSLITLAVAIVVCVVPLIFVVRAIYSQATEVVAMFQSGRIDIGKYLTTFDRKAPAIAEFLARFGVDPADIGGQVSSAISAVGKSVTGKAVHVATGTARFFVALGIMLYLAFFMLRDGGRVAGTVVKAIPMGDGRGRLLIAKFVETVKAMVKGTLVIACVQGFLGGLTFWILGITGPVLWGFVMAVMSMVPVLGTWVVWAPVAVYLLLTPVWYKGLILIAVGVLVIGMVDNLLRPRLVGRDTRMPDWLVLLSTLGGLAAFGIHGFIIGPVVAALFIAFWQIFVHDFS